MHYTEMAAAGLSLARVNAIPGLILPTFRLAAIVTLLAILLLSFGLLAVFIDRWAETRRQAYEANERLRRMIDALSGYAIYTVSTDGIITSWNASAERLTGYTSEHVIGMDFTRFGPEEDRQKIFGELDIAAQTGRAEATYVRQRRDGQQVSVHSVTTPLHDADGRTVGFVRVTRDITEETRAAEEMDAQRVFLNAMLHSVNTGIVACDSNGRLTLFNRATRELHGLPADSSLSAEDWATHYALYEPDGTTLMKPERIPLARALKGEIFRDVEMVVAPKGEKRRHLLVSGQPIKTSSGKPLGAVVALHDVTERIEAEAELRAREAELRQAHKMEAVGQLAGGVAHDFNNILTAIRVNAELMLMDLPEDAPEREGLAEVTAAVDRASHLTRQLLSFSRKQVTQPVVVNPNEVIVSLNAMLRPLMVGDVELVTKLAPDLGAILIDRAQLEQVIVNLVVNGRDAMPKGGTLTIETANLSATGRRSADNTTGSLDQILISVTDTGTGMTAEVQRRMYEPFFTTKERGKGTGLGLATAYAIVTQSGGQISVTSAPGKGTSLRLLFPRGDSFKASPECAEGSPMEQRGSETVLVVDDEESIRRSVAAILRKRGYSVVEAASGKEALAIIRGGTERFDLLLTDIMMPGMHGGELVRHFRALRPKAKVLCMSGYADDEIVSRGIIGAGIDFIQKPFTVESLAHRVRRALDTSPLS